MGKGLSQRRRAANFLKARKESGKLSGLPPPPDEVGGKRKRRGAQDDMPSSLRHMLELKAKLEGQQRKRPKHAASTHAPPAGLRPPGASSQAEQPTLRNAEPAQPSAADPPAQPAGGAAEPSSSEPAEGLGPEVCGTSGGDLEERSAGTSAGGPANKLASGHEQVANQQIRRREGKASRADAQRTGNSKQGLGVGSGSGQDPWQPDGGTAAPGAAFAPKSGLKQRKKDFLNRRKLKKRGRAVSEAEAGDRLERRLLQDPQRPASGEQALAPLKVNLKRKHWGASGAEPRAGQRCRDAFQRRLAPAAAAGPSGGQDGYRVKSAQQSGAQQGASQAPAKSRSRPAVKPAGEGPTAGAHGAGAARGRQGRGFKALEARRNAAAAVAAQSALRDGMVQAYRERTKGPRAGGPASARSLAALVQREALS